MSGSGFGSSVFNNATSHTLRYQALSQPSYAGVNCTVVVDDVEMECVSVAGVGATSVVEVSIGGLSFTSPTTRYGSPCLRSVSGPGASAASSVGGDEVVLTGDNFGPLGSAHIDFVVYGRDVVPGAHPLVASLRSPLYTATACAVTVAHHEMRCLSAAGVGSRHVWSVSVGGQVSSVCDDSSVAAVTSGYGSPWIAEVAVLATADSPAGSLQTEGGSVVVLRGGNFGPPSCAIVVVNGVPYTGVVSHGSHSEIQFLAPPGVGPSVGLSVRAGDQASVVGTSLSFHPPAVVSIASVAGMHRRCSRCSLSPRLVCWHVITIVPSAFGCLPAFDLCACVRGGDALRFLSCFEHSSRRQPSVGCVAYVFIALLLYCFTAHAKSV